MAGDFWCNSDPNEKGKFRYPGSCSSSDINLENYFCDGKQHGPCRLKVSCGTICDNECDKYGYSPHGSNACGFCCEEGDCKDKCQCICAGLPQNSTSQNCYGSTTQISTACDHLIKTGTHVKCDSSIQGERCYVPMTVGDDCSKVCADNHGGDACGYCGTSGTGACICKGKKDDPPKPPPQPPQPPGPPSPPDPKIPLSYILGGTIVGVISLVGVSFWVYKSKKK